MTTETETTVREEVGRLFNIKLGDGSTIETECTFWDSERRAFKATDDSGFIDMDWMEYSDQLALGRIEMILPELVFE